MLVNIIASLVCVLLYIILRNVSSENDRLRSIANSTIKENDSLLKSHEKLWRENVKLKEENSSLTRENVELMREIKSLKEKFWNNKPSLK